MRSNQIHFIFFRWQVLFLLILFVFGSSAYGQEDRNRKLRAELSVAKSDTTRMRLRKKLLWANAFLRPDSLIMLADSCIELATRLQDDSGLCIGWHWVGAAESSRGRLNEAKAAFGKSLEFAKVDDDKKGQINALMNLGDLSVRAGNTEEGKAFFDQGNELAIALGLPRYIASVQNNYAVMYAKQGKFAQAAEHFLTALEVHVEAGDSVQVANVVNNLGAVMIKMGDFKGAIGYLIRAADIDDSMGNKRGLATQHYNIAVVYKEIRDYAQAMAYAKSAMAYHQKSGNAEGMANSMILQHLLMYRQNQPDSALALCRAILDTCAVHGLTGPQEGHARIGIGKYYRESGDYSSALTEYLVAEKIFKRCGYSAGLASLEASLGVAYSGLNEDQKALEYLESAYARSLSELDVRSLISVHESMAKLYQKKNQYKAALMHFQQAKVISDSLYQVENNAKIAEIQSQYDLRKKARELREALQEQEALQLKNEVLTARTQLLVVIVISIVFIGLGLVLWLRYRNLQVAVKYKLEEAEAQKLLEREKYAHANVLDVSAQQAKEIGYRNLLVIKLKAEIDNFKKNGQHFGDKEYVALFKIIENNMHTKEDWEHFKLNFERIHPNFISNLVAKYEDLSPAEIRLSVLLRLGMGKKDSAAVLKIHPDSIKRARNRLRHKLDLQPEMDLPDFLKHF